MTTPTLLPGLVRACAATARIVDKFQSTRRWSRPRVETEDLPSAQAPAPVRSGTMAVPPKDASAGCEERTAGAVTDTAEATS